MTNTNEHTFSKGIGWNRKLVNTHEAFIVDVRFLINSPVLIR